MKEIGFCSAMLWKSINDDAKYIESVEASKKEIKTWAGASCLYTICK